MNLLQIPQARLARYVLLGALLVFGWIQLGPTQLGGSLSYVVTSGDSMQPLYSSGDLVVIREGSYEVGDVVASRNPELGQPVLHRIIERSGERFVLKGDNNEHIDGYRPTAGDIIGKEWFALGSFGPVLKGIFSPFILVPLVGLTGWFVYMDLTGSGGRRTRRRSVLSGEPPESAGGDETSPRRAIPSLLGYPARLRWSAGVACWFLLLSLFAWTRPAEYPGTTAVPYRHSGVLTYAGTSRDVAVYQGGRVRSGDPIFAGLVDKVTFSYTYSLSADAPADLSGSARLHATLVSPTGLKRSISLGKTIEEFRGSEVELRGILDVGGLYRTLGRLEERSNFAPGLYSFTVTPEVEVAGAVAGIELDDSFSHVATFQLDAAKIQLARETMDAPSEGLLNASERGSLVAPASVTNTFGIGKLAVPIPALRVVALLGFVLSAALLTLLFARRTEQDRDDGALIVARYGEWLVPVKSLETLHDLPAVEMTSIEGLVRMAEAQDRLALYVEAARVDTFAFEDDGVVYFYRVDAAAPGTAGAPVTAHDVVTLAGPDEDASPERVALHEVVPAVEQHEGSSSEPADDGAQEKTEAEPRVVRTARLVLVAAKTIEDARGTAALLERGRAVVLDTTETTPHAARRINDFATGLVAATGATIEPLGKRAVLITPSGVAASIERARALLARRISISTARKAGSDEP